MTVDRYQIVLFCMGLFVQRISGNLWFWSSIVQSKRFKLDFRAAKRYRQRLLRVSDHLFSNPSQKQDDELQQKLLQQDTTLNTTTTTTAAATTKDNKSKTLQGLKRLMQNMSLAILNVDLNVMSWFRRHERLTTFLGLLGFYLCYMPVDYLYREKLLYYLSIPRMELLNELPSLQRLPQGMVNPSPVFRSLVIAGKSPLLSEDEMNSFLNRFETTEAVLDDIDGVIQVNTCGSAGTCDYDEYYSEEDSDTDSNTVTNDDMNMESFTAFTSALNTEDENFLKNRVSPSSFGEFMGDYHSYFINERGVLLLNVVIFGSSVFLLTQAKVPFFDI